MLLRPLPNADEARLLYFRQSALGIGVENTWFSVPEINDLRAELKSVSRLAEFSTTQPTPFGLGDSREVRAGVVDGGFFEVMALQPVLGRLIGPEDDGPDVEGVVVLTHRFWSSALGSDSSVIGLTVRLSNQPATVIGVLEPAVPYPEETELIANMVTSPHHLSDPVRPPAVPRPNYAHAQLTARLTGVGEDLLSRTSTGHTKRTFKNGGPCEQVLAALCCLSVA